jgi:type I restriction enzyme M protein
LSATSDCLALTDVARLAGVRLSAVSNWRARHADFPKPQVVHGREVFRVRDVAQWLHTRTIPPGRLHSGETPGASYGARLLRNLGISDSLIAAEMPLEDRPPVPRWSVQLHAAMDELRGIQDTASSLEFLLGLAYLKSLKIDIWRSLVQASDGAELQGLLATASKRHIPFLPAFQRLASISHPSINRVVRLIDSIDFGTGSASQSSAGQISDAILGDLERGMGRSGGHFTPPDVAQCMAELLDPQPSDSLYDPFCGSGELLCAAVTYLRHRSDSPGGWQVYGQTPSDWSWSTSTMNLALHGVEADLRMGMALQRDQFPGRRFDRILTNPPFNLKMDVPYDEPWPFGEPPAHNANYAWLQHVLTKLARAGRATVLMPAGAASTGGRELSIRRRMVDAGVVECVIALPSRLFRFTAIPTTVWVLRATGGTSARASMLFIDARHLGEMVDRTKRRLRTGDIAQIADEYRRWRDLEPQREFAGTSGFSHAVSHEQVSTNNYALTPARYTSAASERPDAARVAVDLGVLRRDYDDLSRRAMEVGAMLDARLATLVAGQRPQRLGQTVPLGSVCDVLSGPGTVARAGNRGDVPLVLPRNIKDKQIRAEDLELISSSTAARLARYRLEAGDIVTARTGTLGRYGLVSEAQAGWLLGPGCTRFRPDDDEVNSAYLTNYLGSPSVHGWLMGNATGSAIQHVNAATLRALPIWLPPLELQRAIVDTLNPFDVAVSVHNSLYAIARELQNLVLAALMSPTGTDDSTDATDF